jgi:S1-C subfamily serine protease
MVRDRHSGVEKARRRMLCALAAMVTACATPRTPTRDGFVEIAAELRPTVVQVALGEKVLGSGFWIDRNHVTTCWHVVALNPGGVFTIRTAIGPVYEPALILHANWFVLEARVVARDEVHDLAILQVVGDTPTAVQGGLVNVGGRSFGGEIRPVRLDVSLPSQGERVLLAGYPLGQPYAIVQEGNVAAIGYDLGDQVGQDLRILLSMVANPGNSGGPVFNSRGGLIGVMQAILSSQVGPAGIAVAVPAQFLLVLANQRGVAITGADQH